MEEANAIFNIDGTDVNIQCFLEEKMKDICQRFASKVKMNLNVLIFLYGGHQLNFELKFKDQANSIDKSNKEIRVLVYRSENDYICPKCGEKINLNMDTLEEIIKSNNNIKVTINGTKLLIENIIRNSISNEINMQLQNINLILNTINEDINKNNQKLKNFLNDSIVNQKTPANNINNNTNISIIDNVNNNFINNNFITNANSYINSENNYGENINSDIINNLNNSINNNNSNINLNNNKNSIYGTLDIKLNEIYNNILLFNSKIKDGIDVFVNNKKINMIIEDNKWKIDYDFQNIGQYTFEITFKNKIDSLNGFFEGCSNIISLDLSNFDSSNVTSMKNMFAGCDKLKEIKGLCKLNIKKVTTMEAMFSKCSELEYLDLTNCDTSNVTDMGFMFEECKKLKNIKGLNNFITNKVINLSAMFQECYVLEHLDLSNFNTSNVNDMSYMFNQCRKLKSIKGIKNFITDKVTNMDNMFQLCGKLEYLDLSNFNTSEVTDMSNMFNQCNSLKYLNLLNFTINEGIEIENMFSFQQKEKCEFITNNIELQKIFNSS